ncbi:unnamed protein product [Calypogeia fissa]
MFDLDDDAWHQIKVHLECDLHGTAMEEPFFLHGGRVCIDPSYWTRELSVDCDNNGLNDVHYDGDGDGVGDEDNGSEDSDDEPDYRSQEVEFSDFYRPGKDNWRNVTNFARYVFKAQGKFHAMCRNEIHVYDAERNSWKRRHSVSLPAGIQRPTPTCSEGSSLSTLPVENELLTLLHTDFHRAGTYVFRSIRCGRKKRTNRQKVERSFEVG